MHWRWLAIQIVGGLVGTPARGAADRDASCDWSIDWQAPEGCPAIDTIRDRVRHLATTDCEAWLPVSFSGRVSPSKIGFALELTVRAYALTSMRRLEDPSCEAVTKAAALVMAIALGTKPRLVAPEPPSAAAPPPPAPASVPPPPRAPTAEAEPTQPVATTVIAWKLGGGVGVDVGAVPTVGTNLQTMMSANPGPYRLEVGLGGSLSPSATFGPGPAADTWLLTARLRACRGAWDGLVAACLAGDLGIQQSRGQGISNPSTTTRSWTAPGVGFHVHLASTDRADFSVDLDVLAPLARSRFVVTETGVDGQTTTRQLFQTWPVMGRVVLSGETKILPTD